ncbi:hypothetical protein OPV22_010213 [Ensete ventricosum]|uniref:Uncharacterized protein n=1 Tax=Ensete ventricosum TaxID=4639 RepID=A0AAV8RKD2_ENSVE|nr:hypothetical protein OPV22_010213 [Ensete ventricosum]
MGPRGHRVPTLLPMHGGDPIGLLLVGIATSAVHWIRREVVPAAQMERDAPLFAVRSGAAADDEPEGEVGVYCG